MHTSHRNVRMISQKRTEKGAMRMKRILLCTGAGIGLAAMAALAILTAARKPVHTHTFAPATCTEPMICLSCGETQGEPLGHDFLPATCTEPETCRLCGKTRGEPLGHDFLPATCTEPETCRVCGATRGEPLGHDFLPATCTEPETCRVCGKTRGESLGHDFLPATYESPAVCARCGQTDGEPLPAALRDFPLHEMQVGVPVPYTTASYEDRAVDVTGTAEIAEYCVIKGDETFPPRDGYEWHVATVRLTFSGGDAQKNGMLSALTYGDWYLFDNELSAYADEDGCRRFFVDRCGMRVLCWQKCGPNEEAGWYGRELRFTWREGVLVPNGYDGVLLILYHAGRFAEAGPFPDASAVLDENALVFRMK